MPTFDAVGAGAQAQTGATSASWSHTVASGAVLWVAVIFDDLADHDPTATWNTSESMGTPIIDLYGYESETPRVICVWRLNNPTATTANVAISWTTAAGYAANSISLTEVNGTTPNDAPVAAIFGIENTGDPTGPTVAGETGDLIVGFCGINQPTGTYPTITTAGGTDRALTTNAQIALRISTVPSAASVALAWSQNESWEDWSAVGFNVNAGAAPAGDEFNPIPIPQPLPGALGVYRSIRGRIG